MPGPESGPHTFPFKYGIEAMKRRKIKQNKCYKKKEERGKEDGVEGRLGGEITQGAEQVRKLEVLLQAQIWFYFSCKLRGTFINPAQSGDLCLVYINSCQNGIDVFLLSSSWHLCEIKLKAACFEP